MRELEKKERAGNKRARLAREMFVYRIRKYIGAYSAVMGGCDALIFAGGIGEHQASLRSRIVKDLFGHLKKSPKVLVVPTDEELAIARQTFRLVSRSVSQPVSRLTGKQACRR
jgi:acetate kinase